MRNMSFAATQQQILDQTKMVTRRIGWRFLKPGDIIQPVNKCQGLKAGEHPVKLGCPIRVKNVTRQTLLKIDNVEVIAEGFYMLPDDFVKMFMAMNCCSAQSEVTRIEYEYTDPLIKYRGEKWYGVGWQEL